MLMFILCSNCRILLVRCDEPPRTDNSSVVMFTSSSPTYSIVGSGDNGGANGFRVAAAKDHHEDDVDGEEEQYLDILMSALNITKLPDIAKVRS